MQQVIYKLKITVTLLLLICRTCQSSSGEKPVFKNMSITFFTKKINKSKAEKQSKVGFLCNSQCKREKVYNFKKTLTLAIQIGTDSILFYSVVMMYTNICICIPCTQGFNFMPSWSV